MGISTGGQISFGIPFDEDYEFPWDCEKHDGDIEDWWVYGICGYKDPITLYTDDGKYINNPKPSKEDFDLYYDTKKTFLADNPLPVELVNYCSGDYPMYMISIPQSCLRNSRGYPHKFKPQELTTSDEMRKTIIEFCQKYCKPKDDTYSEFPKMEPEWYLSSLWS